MSIHEELLLEILDSWSIGQLDSYIERQEGKLKETQVLLTKLREIRRKRNKKQPLNNGERSGA